MNACAEQSWYESRILTYAAVFFLLQRYVSRPSTARLPTLAGGIAVAFLFRHDHGAYLAAGSALAALLVPPGSAGLAARARRVLTLGAAVAAMLLPYVAFVHVHRGLWQYLQVGLEFGAREFKRAPYEWPTLSGADALQAPLFYQYWALPVAAVLLLSRTSTSMSTAIGGSLRSSQRRYSCTSVSLSTYRPGVSGALT